MACLNGSSPRGLRDRAIKLCVSRLGLRAGEVVGLGLGDIDWRNAIVRVSARKTGHGALLPCPRDLGQALSEYLTHGRPDTGVTPLFVQSRAGKYARFEQRRLRALQVSRRRSSAGNGPQKRRRSAC